MAKDWFSGVTVEDPEWKRIKNILDRTKKRIHERRLSRIKYDRDNGMLPLKAHSEQ